VHRISCPDERTSLLPIDPALRDSLAGSTLTQLAWGSTAVRGMMQNNQDGLNLHIASETQGRRVHSFQVPAMTRAQVKADAKARAEAPSAIEALSRIRATVKSVNPLRLLSRICIQCGFYEASEAGAFESYASLWASWGEVVARLICSGDCVVSRSVDPTKETIETLFSDFTKYWQAITPEFDPTTSFSNKDDLVASLAAYSRIHAVTVKYDARVDQLDEAAQQLYSPQNKWLKENRGFTIEEALATMSGIYRVVHVRAQLAVRAATAGLTPAALQEIKVSEILSTELDTHPDLAVLTAEEITAVAQIPREACAAVLARFSQHVDEQTCQDSSRAEPDALQLPFLFNEIHRRPLVEIGGKYVCTETTLPVEAVFTSLHFDLWRDESVRGSYGNNRGAWLERAAAAYLRSVFGPEAVCVNPYRDDGNELCDVLVHYDHVVLVVSCKAKMLTALAEYGGDAGKLRDDLQKGIGDSHTQVEGALAYLQRSGGVNVHRQNRELWTSVRSTELDVIVPIYVLPNSYQNLTIGVKNILSGLGIRVDQGTLPWIVSVFDLQNVAEMLNESPALFLHYLERRRGMALARARLEATEADLVSHYLLEGLVLGNGSEYADEDHIVLGDLAAPVSEYLIKEHVLGVEVPKPRSQFPFVLSGLVAEITQTGAPHRTVSLMRLLEINRAHQTEFLGDIDSCRQKALVLFSDESTTTNVTCGDAETMISYFSGRGTTSELIERAKVWVREVLRLRRGGTHEWVCLVGDVSGSTRVQSVIYVSTHEGRKNRT